MITCLSSGVVLPQHDFFVYALAYSCIFTIATVCIATIITDQLCRYCVGLINSLNLATSCYVFIAEVNIDISNDSSLKATITNYKTSGTYTKQPKFIGVGKAKAEIYVSIINIM